MQDFIITEYNQKIVELAQVQSQFTGSIGATQTTSTMEDSNAASSQVITNNNQNQTDGSNSIGSDY